MTAKDVAAKAEEGDISLSWFTAITTYGSFAILIVFGHIRDFFARTFGYSRYFGKASSSFRPNYAPLLKDWENFFTRRLYHRSQDAWNRPIGGPPVANGMRVVLRTTQDNNCTMEITDEERKCVNLGSYNYLGFADDWHETCRDDVVNALDTMAVSTCSPMSDAGTTTLHKQLEKTVAEFVGKEDAIVFNMGYGTNATGIPALAGKGSLLVSDSLNHTSIVNGARASGAVIRVFKHNNPRNLEAVLRRAIEEGQPRTHRPWKKIIVVIEGIYSMEGEIVNLPAIVDVCKRHKAYIYLDEAHSIGAVGPTGRGVCEYWGVDTKDIDIMMGTFTKSFGAMGGYIAADKSVVNFLRHTSAGSISNTSMSPIICQQVLTAFKVLTGKDGTNIGKEKLRRLKENANYFRERLEKMGVHTLGDYDSPIIPMLLFHPAKISAFSNIALEQNIAVVVVGFPATPLTLSRVRFCISAGHTREALDKSLEGIEKIVDLLQLRYSCKWMQREG